MPELEVEFLRGGAALRFEEEAKYHLELVRACLKLNAECDRMYGELRSPPPFNWRIFLATHREVI